LSQRASGYKRRRNDAYYTPPWVTEGLLPHIRIKPNMVVLDPADGAGHISSVFAAKGFKVQQSDITRGIDFLKTECCTAHAIVTNPPYGMAEQFIAHALGLTEPDGLVAMLLRCDYDHAATRAYLFERPFAMRIALRRRIRWIEGSTGSPSFNHSWYVWDWQHQGPPTVGYAP